jgi:hypothetical protein
MTGCASGGDGDYGGDDGGYDGRGSGVARESGAPLEDAATPASDAIVNQSHDAGSVDAGGTDDAGGMDAAIDSGPDSSAVGGQKTVFVTSVVYGGNLGGLAGADSKCQTLADAASLGGTFRAWLSDGTGTAAARLTHSSGAYVLVDGTVVANDWTQLASGTLLHPIDETEQKGAATAGSASSQACFGAACAWTDTNADGTLAEGSFSCVNWSSQSPNDNAVLGETTATTTYWSSFATSSGVCDLTAPLYCVQQ